MGAHFFAALVVDGALAGALYALVALSFVVVYRASRMINFAVGEWVMLASRFVTFGLHALGLGLLGALAVGCAGMAGLGVAFNRVVLRRLVGQPLISVIMVTLGLGALVRGAAALAFGGVPAAIPLPVLASPIVIGGLPIAGDKLVAAAVAATCTAVVAWVFHGSRTGVALRAIADDQQAAMSAGIDLHRYFAITWALMGVVSVLAGTLWTLVAGGGLGIVLVGLKVFPIVIIGGLDSIPGTVVGALGVGVLESLAAGYLDPLLGGGFSNIASYLVLLGRCSCGPMGCSDGRTCGACRRHQNRPTRLRASNTPADCASPPPSRSSRANSTPCATAIRSTDASASRSRAMSGPADGQPPRPARRASTVRRPSDGGDQCTGCS